MRPRNENAVSIVANSVDYILDGIGRSCCEHNVLRLYCMNGMEVGVEELG
jgi:hypothetical protein